MQNENVAKEISIDQFTEAVAEELVNKLTDEEKERITVEVQRVNKNNGVIRHGLIIRDSLSPIAPTIYTEQFYEERETGVRIDECAAKIMKVYRNCRLNMPDGAMNFLENFDETAERIIPKMINADKNEKFLEEVPHVMIGDLAVIFQIRVDTLFEEGTGTITINNQMAGKWDKNAYDLLRTARENIHEENLLSIRSMYTVLREMMLRPGRDESNAIAEAVLESMEDEKAPKMFVLTSKAGVNGAVGLMEDDILADFADKMASDLYILPSSIHELIIVPTSEAGDRTEELLSMVKEVNATQVQKEDFLSDNVYSFKRKERALCFALTGEQISLQTAIA